jgi:hypothetical protein
MDYKTTSKERKRKKIIIIEEVERKDCECLQN